MATAKKVSDIPGRAAVIQERRAARSRQVSRKSSISDKTFEELGPLEKDLLLKQLGVTAGLIKDSDD